MLAKSKKIPKFLQPILWSSSIRDVDLQKHKAYVIHQVLIYGDFRELSWLFHTYSKKEVADVFIKQPYKNYNPSAYNFVKDYLLGLGDGITLPENNYVSAFFGGARRIPPTSFLRT